MSENKRNPTIQDVAERAGVSRAAVSKVLRDAYGVSPAMKTKVDAAIRELDYRPSIVARSLRGSSFVIGIQMPSVGSPSIGNLFFDKLTTGATAALRGSRYRPLLGPATRDENEAMQAVQTLADHQVDGLVVISSGVERAWLERTARQLPLVMIGRHDITEAYDTVNNDDAAGAAMALDHLFDLGHRHIAHFTVPDAELTPDSATSHAVRRSAYESIMRERGLSPQTTQLAVGAESEARSVARALLESPDRPTAIFAGNDSLALEVLWAREELGLTTADVSVVGYDNVAIAAHPMLALTTIDQFGTDLGSHAVKLLLERLDGRSSAQHLQIKPQLRRRGSTSTAREH